MDRRQIVDAVRRAVDRCGDVGEAAARLGVRPSTLSKILQGRQLSPQAHQKLITQLRTPGVLQEPSSHGNARLETVHRLYLELGTLQAAAETLDLTRERVRQLLVKGTRLGLFEYKPRDIRSLNARRFSVRTLVLLIDQGQLKSLGSHRPTCGSC